MNMQTLLELINRKVRYNKWALIKVMGWRWLGSKSLPEPLMTKFTEGYMHHKAPDNWIFI